MEQYQVSFRSFLAAGNSFGKVAVLYGGTSAEREVSLRSGRAVAAGLREQGVDVVECDVNENVVAQIASLSFDRAFIALHGTGGEDGRIQGLLDLLGKPYTGSRHAASAVGMDKLTTKQIWLSDGLLTPQYKVVSQSSNFDEVMLELGGEAFVKPVHEGSSIGMRCVATGSELEGAITEALQYDSVVLAERRINGPEFSVGVLNGFALPPVGLQASNAFYDYDAKYHSNDTVYQCPCDLSEEKIQQLRSLALSAFESVGCVGWGRVDVMQDESGDFYLLEVNTVPGMTDHSLVPMAAKAIGMSFSELVCEILYTSVDA